MLEILPLFCLSLFLAYCSQKNNFILKINENIKIDLAFVFLVIALSVFAGLRTNYNDTWLYKLNFKNAVPLSEYLATDPGFFDNPFFYGFQCFFRHNISNNFNLFCMLVSFFIIFSILRLIKKYSKNFVLSMTIFFALALYYDILGAMKQTIAIAILTYAVDALIKKKTLLYLCIVILATLFHSYAIFYLILIIFINRPWSVTTYITVFAIAVLLLTFESTLDMIMSAAEDAGKNLAEEEMKDNNGISPFRLIVFAIPPILTLLFQDNLNPLYDRSKCILVNMSIISFLIMSLGIFTAANMFGRCAGYFLISSIIILPWIIEEIFDKESVKFASIIVGLCYVGFFYMESLGFDAEYTAMGLGEFFLSLSGR